MSPALNELARGMSALIKPKSNLQFAFDNVIDSFLSIPRDVYSISRDYIDTDNRYRNSLDKERLLRLVRKGITSHDVKNLIFFVVKEYVKGLNEKQLGTLALKLGSSFAGGFAFKAMFINKITSLFFEKIIPKFLFTAGITGVLSIGAAMSSSVYKSYELKNKNTRIYNILRSNGDLDLLYFLVFDNVDPFVDAINLQERNAKQAEQLFNLFIKEL